MAEAARTASGSVQAVATASEQLSAMGREIAGQAASSLVASRQSAAETRAAAASIGTLTAAAAAIDDVVRAIAAIASRTNLLALNATDRGGAGRRGGAGICDRGRGGKGTRAADGGFDARYYGAYRGHAERYAGQRGGYRAANEAAAGIDRTSEAVAAAVEAQEATIREVTGRLQETSAETKRVADLVDDVAAHSARVRASAEAAQEDAARTDATIEALRGDLTVQLRRAAGGESCAIPLALAATLRGGVSVIAVTVLELSESGALRGWPRGRRWWMAGGWSLRCRARAPCRRRCWWRAGAGRRLSLQPRREQALALRDKLAVLRADAERFGACARGNAAELQGVLEGAIERGVLGLGDLFDSEYWRVEGTDQQQYIAGLPRRRTGWCGRCSMRCLVSMRGWLGRLLMIAMGMRRRITVRFRSRSGRGTRCGMRGIAATGGFLMIGPGFRQGAARGRFCCNARTRHGWWGADDD